MSRPTPLPSAWAVLGRIAGQTATLAATLPARIVGRAVAYRPDVLTAYVAARIFVAVVWDSRPRADHYRIERSPR